METLNILVTGGGSPGIAGTIYSLKRHRIVTTDVRDDVPGKYLSDKFYRIAPATDEENYLDDLQRVCEREKIDVVLPQNTAELDVLWEKKDDFCTKIAVSGPNIPKNAVSEGVLVHNFDELTDFARKHEKFVIKPPKGNGSRGVRIVTDEKPDFYRKPGIPIIEWRRLYDEVGETFELFAQPFYQGTEFTVDCFIGKGRFAAFPRVRSEIRSGITFAGEFVKNFALIEQSFDLAVENGLRYAFGFQFIGGNVIECNPRVQGTMAACTLAGANIIEAAVMDAVGLPIPELRLDWDYSFNRYWGMIGSDGKKI